MATRPATGELLARFLRASSFAVVGASPARDKVRGSCLRLHARAVVVC